MKKITTALLLAVFTLFLTGQVSYSQDLIKKIKPAGTHKKGPSKSDRKKVMDNIDKNTKKINIQSRGAWLLEEDFESGFFPPSGWSVNSGSTEWEQYYGASGYGNGMVSMFYSSWNCNYSDNVIYTSGFSSTQFNDKLIFDFAYAPYDDGYSYYDALEIYYYDDNESDWYSLIYYNGEELQTAPGTDQYFQPQSNEWGTMIVDLPPNASQIYFQVYENCSNNLFIDNIKIGEVSGNVDASVENVWAKGKLPLVFGVPDKIPVLIKNNSIAPMTNLKVYLNITGTNTLYDSLVIPYLGPLDTMQVEFLGYNPVLNGFSSVTAFIPPDDNNSNNSKTFISEVNTNKVRYVDSACCNSSVGWSTEYAFMNKYYMKGTGQVRKVNVKISGDVNSIGQIVYGYVVNSSGVVVGKSPHYKLKSTDNNTYKSFEITDPKPFLVTNDFYYVGIAQTEYSGSETYYGPLQILYEIPARPDANYFTNLVPPGSSTYGVYELSRSSGLNYAMESEMGNQASVDVGISNLGLVYDQYFNSTTHSPVGKVFNAGTGSSSFSVRRTITPGGYTSTKTVSSLASGANAIVTFDPWTFTSGTAYTVRDSILISDGNNTNNQMNAAITPRVAKELCVLYSQQQDRDSLVRAILNDGRYANNFDTVGINYTGAYKPWKIMFVNIKQEANHSAWVRDSMKAFVDNSSAGNKKSLIVFGDAIATSDEPSFGFPTPADTVFYRQYLKAQTINTNWVTNIPASGSKFRGIGLFNGITQDSVSEPYSPELIKPVNGSSPAFKPKSVTGNGNDSCIAVSFAGVNYNTFFMTNRFSSLRATSGSPSSPLGPVIVYKKIIDWIQSSGSSAKNLDLTARLQGFYNSGTNTMVSDTMRVFLRNSTSPYAIVDSAKAKLSASGQATFSFNNASNGTPYYLQLKHRNGLETWSKTTQSFSSNSLTYNFTTDSAKAFGNNMLKQGASWVVYTGDVNQSGSIDLTDIVQINNNASLFATGYLVTDVNGDNMTDLTDLILTSNNSGAFVQKVIPSSGPEILTKYGVTQDLIINNAKVNITDHINIDFTPDHDVYEKYKNIYKETERIPEVIFTDKNNIQKRISGNNKE